MNTRNSLLVVVVIALELTMVEEDDDDDDDDEYGEDKDDDNDNDEDDVEDEDDDEEEDGTIFFCVFLFVLFVTLSMTTPSLANNALIAFQTRDNNHFTKLAIAARI